jgi:hypothetical protein
VTAWRKRGRSRAKEGDEFAYAAVPEEALRHYLRRSRPTTCRLIPQEWEADPPAGMPVVTFFIRLPFDVTLPTGSGLAPRRDAAPDSPPSATLAVGRCSIELAEATLRPYDRGLEVLLGDREPDLSAGGSRQTWIVAETLALLYEDEDETLARDEEGGALSILFERCLALINVFLRAEQAVFGNPWSYLLTKEALDPHCHTTISDPDTGAKVERPDFRLHTRPYNPALRVSLEDDEIASVLNVAVSQRMRSSAAAFPHPLMAGRDLAARAATLRLWGDSLSALLNLESSAEVLLRGVHHLLLLDASHVRGSEPAASTDGPPFRTLLSRDLPALLGGDWSSERSPITQFVEHLYEPRNVLVHAGREPHWRDIEPAFQAYDALLVFLSARIRAGWRSHTRTLAAWEDPWAGGDDDVPAAAVEIVGTLRMQEPPYWLPRSASNRAWV